MKLENKNYKKMLRSLDFQIMSLSEQIKKDKERLQKLHQDKNEVAKKLFPYNTDEEIK